MAVMLSWYWQRKKEKNQKEKQAKNRIEWITGGHIPHALAKILFPLLKTWKVYSTKAIISENRRPVPEGKSVPGGGTEIPRDYELFQAEIHNKFVREKTKNCEC